MSPEQSSEAERERLLALYGYQLQDDSTLAAFDDFAAIAASIVGTRMAAVTLLDDTTLWLKGRHGFDVSPLPRGDALCAHVVEQDATFVVPDSFRYRFKSTQLPLWSSKYVVSYATLSPVPFKVLVPTTG